MKKYYKCVVYLKSLEDASVILMVAPASYQKKGGGGVHFKWNMLSFTNVCCYFNHLCSWNTLLVIGVVLREQGSAVTEDQDRLLRVDQRFTSFTSWNLDKPPSADDKLNKAMQWIDIAKAVSNAKCNYICHVGGILWLNCKCACYLLATGFQEYVLPMV